MDYLTQVWGYTLQHSGVWVAQAVAALLVAVGGALLWGLARQAWGLIQQARCFVQSRARTLNAVEQDWSKPGAPEGRGLWLTKPIVPPVNYRQMMKDPPVLSVANLKGGVGKTTLVANIGAFLAKEWSLRVLLIDLDFQGSLSSMAIPTGSWLPVDGQSSLATKLISGTLPAHLVPNCAIPIDLGAGSRGSLSLIPAYYDLAQADNRIMVEWLLKCRPKRSKGVIDKTRHAMAGPIFVQEDVRYTLAEILHSEIVAKAYDLILIDCPPRLTTGEIQAFCASSRVLIPTILDRPSQEAVVSICNQIRLLREAGVCPNLNYLGVVGTMIRGNVNYAAQLARLRATLDQNKIDAGILLTKTFMPHTIELVKNPDDGIGYLAMADTARHERIKAAIGELATYVAEQMGIPRPPSFQETPHLGMIPGAEDQQ